MASIRDLKKNINYAFGEVIDAVLIWEVLTDNNNSKEGKEIIDEAISSYDTFIDKVNKRNVEDRGQYLKSVNQDFEKKVNELVEKINHLG